MPKSLKENGQPAQQWYWDDWFSAFDVRLCSVAARGLWIDMLGIMWKAKPRGTLTINGEPVTLERLAKLANASKKEVNLLLKELEEKKVYSKLENGIIINRRLYLESVERKALSEVRREAGRKGGLKKWQKFKQNASKNSKGMAEKVAMNTVQLPREVNGRKTLANIAKLASSSPSPNNNINKEEESIVKEIIKEREILNLLKNTKNFNYMKEKDLKFIKDMVIEFSDIDVFEVIKRLCANWIDRPLFKRSRPRVQIRVWCKNERKWNEERRLRLMAGQNIRKPTEKERKFKLEYDKRRKELEKKYLPEVQKARRDGDPKGMSEIDNKIKKELAVWTKEYWEKK